jgi:hypothetical protein
MLAAYDVLEIVVNLSLLNALKRKRKKTPVQPRFCKHSEAIRSFVGWAVSSIVLLHH